MTREEQKEKRRIEILQVGLQEFILRGYGACKIQDIAKAAGISVGLLFHYFESKKALFLELVNYGISGPKLIVSSFGELQGIAFFEHSAKKILELSQSDAFTANMFVLMSSVLYNQGIPEEAKSLAVAQMEEFYTCSESKILEGQNIGEIKPGEAKALSNAFWFSLQACVSAYAADKSLALPEANWIVDIVRK